MTDLSGLSDQQLMALAQSQGGLTPVSPVQVQPLPAPTGTNSYGQPVAGSGYNVDLTKLTPEQLQAYAENADPKMSAAEDIGRSAVTGGERGAAGLLGTPGDVENAFGRLVAEGLHHGYGALQDLTGSNLGVPYMGSKNKSFTTADMNFADLPDSGAINHTVQQVAGPYHTPQTTGGHIVERGMEYAPMALLPGGPLARLARVVAPSGGSLVGEAVAPEGSQDLGALIGALAGGGVEGAGESIGAAPRKLMARAVSETSPADMAAASDLQRRAMALPGGGVRLTPFEALDQVTNGGAKSGVALQHFVENSPVGRPLTAPIFADRPAQLSAAVRGTADAISPPDMAPSASALAAQDSATGVLRKFDQMRTAATRPYYSVADAQTVDPTDLSDLHDAISTAAAADKTGKIAPVLQGFLDDLTPGGKPLTDIGSLDTIRKIWRDRFDLPPNSPNALGKTQAGTLAPFVDQLDGLMTSASKPFEQGKALHADLSRNVVDPANNGPLGTISDTRDLASQVRALYPSSPPEGAAVETGTAARLLPQDVTANLTRHNLVDTWNGANTDLQSGQNQWAGSRFAKAVAGHDEQQKALYAGLHAIDPSDSIGQQVADLVETGRATGKRWAPGSLTQFNAEQAKLFGTSPAPIRTAGALMDPLEWGKAIDHAVGGALYRRNVEHIAKVLRMSPDDAEAALRSAKAGASGNPLAAALLLTAPAASGSP